MNNVDRQYLDLLRDILENGVVKADRTGVGTHSVFGRMMRFDMREGFPLITTKKLYIRAIVHELLWFLKGGDNIKYLVDNGVNIWNEWPWRRYCAALHAPNRTELGKDLDLIFDRLPEPTLDEFVERIRTDADFAKAWGKLGPVYGKQWVRWTGVTEDGRLIDVNQIDGILDDLRNNPDSRRIMVNAWNVSQVPDMLLPPCHWAFQLWTRELPDGRRSVSLMFHMRSVDLGLGWCFDVASYGFLLHMIAQCVDMIPDELIITTGDTHIYLNHVEGLKLQLEREPFPLPTLWLNPNVKNIYDFKFTDIKLLNYKSHPSIKLNVAI